MARAEYRRLLTQAYDIDKPAAPPMELSYYRELIRLGSGPVLEAMCGSGRFLVPLLQSGIDIDGMDASSDMLDACREKCVRLGLSTSLEQQEVQTLTPRRTYEFIFCGGGSFGLIADMDDVSAALTRMRAALSPGGRLVLEVETPATAGRAGRWGARWWRRPDGALIVLRDVSSGVDADVEEAIGIYELYVDGALVETELNEWVRRFWSEQGIVSALDAAGLDEIRVTEAFGSAPATADTLMLSVTAVASR